MKIPHAFQRVQGSEEFGAAIRVGERGRAESETLRWGLVLVVFMRLLAVLWMVQGLGHWLDVLTSPDSLFDTMKPAATTAFILFSVLDLVAAVGLWLATPWGGVLWLLAALSQIFVSLALSHFFETGRFLIVSDVVLIVIYFLLTWKAGHSSRRPRLFRRNS